MKIAIIGGGAAGLMAAAAICENHPGHEVTLIERNADLGRKVKISGGGRCNVTTGAVAGSRVLNNYPRGGKFLHSAMAQFTPDDVRYWFEKRGVPLKQEEDGRVFPVSDNGTDVVRVFETMFRSCGVKVITGQPVSSFERTDGGYSILLEGNKDPLVADKVILTTGGQAYRHTGSQGDGYNFVEALGHHITPLAPSLSSFTVKEEWVGEVAGVSFREARVSVKGDPKKSHVGALMFTHRGITGPAVFALSSITAYDKIDPVHPLSIVVDLLPELSEGDLTKLIVKESNDQPTRFFSNTLAQHVPKSIADICCRLVGVPNDRHSGKVGKRDAARCAAWLKGILLSATSRPAGEEFVTAGGVDLKEVNPSTLESKVSPGLYMAGEILDIDGFTGGFNLQAAWCTGRLAGLSAASEKNEEEPKE